MARDFIIADSVVRLFAFVHRRFDDVANQAGLTTRQYYVLRYIHQFGRHGVKDGRVVLLRPRLFQRLNSDLLDFSQSDLTEVLNQLQEKGLVIKRDLAKKEKEVVFGDVIRGKGIILTEKGAMIYERFHRAIERRFSSIVSGSRTMSAIISRLLPHAEKLADSLFEAIKKNQRTS